MLFEIGITTAELVLAKPSATISAKRRWMNTFKHKITGLVYHISLTTCKTTPEHVNNTLALCCQSADCSIGELLPTQRSMTVSLMGTDSKCGVQEQHPLLGPTRQVTRGRNGCTQVIGNLLENILERWREWHTILHRKAQSVRLSWFMIRVLSQNDHLYPIKRSLVKGIEDESTGWIAYSCTIFLTNRLCQLHKIRFIELILQMFLPRRFYLYIHLFLVLCNKVKD